MYRMATALAPYASHPDLPQFHGQIEECADRLAEVGALAAELGIRLSSHPGQYTVLNSENERVQRLAADKLEVQAALFDALDLGPESVVVLHVGGLAGGLDAGAGRFEAGFELLSEPARRRLVIENDDRSYPIGRVVALAGHVTEALAPGPDGRPRCWWGLSAPDYVAYHDDEWGRPVHRRPRDLRAADPGGVSVRALLADDPAQARELPGRVRRLRLRAVAAYDDADFERLMGDAGSSATGPRSRRRSPTRGRRCELARTASRLPRSPGRFGPTRDAAPAGSTTSRDHAGVQGAGQGAQAARLPLRRPDHRLRADAGGRDRQRPPRRLLRSRRGGGRAMNARPQAARPRDLRGLCGRRPRGRRARSSPTTSPFTARRTRARPRRLLRALLAEPRAIESFEFVRLIEDGDEVVVTYESTKTDGRRLRNTEVLTFAGDQLRRAEVYFGWDLD